MARSLLLINGLPGSGKTTLGRGLSAALGSCLLSKDDVKDRLAELVPPDRMPARLGVIAMNAVWDLADTIEGDVIIESWWFRPRDLTFVQSALRRLGDRPAVEVWCEVNPALAEARYRGRRRAAFYEDSKHLAQDWPAWRVHGEPLSICPVVRVDTTGPVDIDAVARAVRSAYPYARDVAPQEGGGHGLLGVVSAD